MCKDGAGDSTEMLNPVIADRGFLTADAGLYKIKQECVSLLIYLPVKLSIYIL